MLDRINDPGLVEPVHLEGRREAELARALPAGAHGVQKATPGIEDLDRYAYRIRDVNPAESVHRYGFRRFELPRVAARLADPQLEVPLGIEHENAGVGWVDHVQTAVTAEGDAGGLCARDAAHLRQVQVSLHLARHAKDLDAAGAPIGDQQAAVAVHGDCRGLERRAGL